MKTTLILCAAAAVSCATLIAAQSGFDPAMDKAKITTDDGSIKIHPKSGAAAYVQGPLHVDDDITLDGLDGQVGDTLNDCKANQTSLQSRVTALQSDIGEQQSNYADQINSMLSSLHSLQSEISTVDSTHNAQIAGLDRDLTESHSNLRSHVDVTVNQSNDDLSGALIDSVSSITVAFDEVDRKYDEAGMWEYSFSGNARINQAFAYWFSIDHGGQGAVNNTHGIGDTYHCGNWFVDVEAKLSHCGGGCHAAYLHQKVYFNGYCSQTNLMRQSSSPGNGGSWSIVRQPDGHNGHGHVCHTFKVQKNAGPYSFGGPYFIRVRSTKPLKILHSFPWGNCAFQVRGFRNCGGCTKTVYRSSNCHGHMSPPGECRQGRSAVSSLGYPSDPTDPAYRSNITSVCCVSCN